MILSLLPLTKALKYTLYINLGLLYGATYLLEQSGIGQYYSFRLLITHPPKAEGVLQLL